MEEAIDVVDKWIRAPRHADIPPVCLDTVHPESIQSIAKLFHILLWYSFILNCIKFISFLKNSNQSQNSSLHFVPN